MPKDAKTPNQLTKRLKELLEDDKQREAAKQIEKAAITCFGEELNFVYRSEAEKIAAIPSDKLDDFATEVLTIKLNLNKLYTEAAAKLGDDNE